MSQVIFLLFCSVFFISSYAQTIVWKQMASLPEGCYCGEAVTLDDEIYFVAGRNDISVTPYFYKFNPKLNTWKKLADIPNPAINLAMGAVNGKNYVIGGDRFQNRNRE